MFSLTNRLRLSWLTLVAFAAFTLVVVLRPADIDVVSVEFARTAAQFQSELLVNDETHLAIGTVNMLRAQLASDMVFLVAYGLLLGATLRGLTDQRWRRLGYITVIATMVADAVENIFALLALRRIGEGTAGQIPQQWLVAMNAAAIIKWALAAIVLGWIAWRWRKQVVHQSIAWRRWAAWTIVLALTAGALASAATALSYWLPAIRGAASVALVAPAAALLIQFRLLDTITLVIRFVILARSTFIVLFLLTAFGPLSLGPAANLLGGILTASNFSGVFFTAMAAIFLLSAAGTQINIVRAHGWLRVNDPTLRLLDHPVLATAVFWTGVVAVSSLLFCVGLASYDMDPLTIILAALLGAVAAAGLLFGIEWVGSLLSDQPKAAPLADTGLPFRAVPALRGILNRAAEVSPRFRMPIVAKLVGKLLGVDTGYVETTPTGMRLLPGHVFALCQLVLTLGVYALLLIGKDSPVDASLDPLSTEQAFWVPTITSVLILFLLAGWAFGAVAFFIDRYRIALLAAVLLVA
ncbi:MAG TPA: hypothetical protein VEA16_03860, partial [Vicinamibacterales bacterium]|nr:hypothetical protein [Vicinamibacterales bacterium]